MSSVRLRLREQFHRDSFGSACVEHDFARELGDDSLPLEKFQRYFVQDYAFFHDDFVVSSDRSRHREGNPNMDAARPLAGFLHEILQVRNHETLLKSDPPMWTLAGKYPPVDTLNTMLYRVCEVVKDFYPESERFFLRSSINPN